MLPYWSNRWVKLWVVVVMAVALAFVVSPAFAWEAVKSSNGLVLSRESDDATSSVWMSQVYVDYKGGSTWSSAFAPYETGSYARLVSYSYTAANSTTAFEIPLVADGGRIQLVRLWNAEGVNHYIPVIYEPLRVAVQGTVPVSVATTLPVSLSATMPISLETTLPVLLAGIEGVSPVEWATILLALGFLIGAALYSAVRRVWAGGRRA